MKLERWINRNKVRIDFVKDDVFTVPPTPAMWPFSWLFSLQFHMSSLPSKNSPLRGGNTKREQTCDEHPSLQTMILSYLATLISSAFSIFFFKHVNAAALLCSLLLLTTATEYSLGLHLPVILYNAKCAISKICTLNLVLLWVFVRLNIIYMDKNLSMI